jgi:transposase
LQEVVMESTAQYGKPDALQNAPAPTQLAVLQLFLQRLKLLDRQIQGLDQLVAQELKKPEEVVVRVAQIPGFGVDSAQQIIAAVGVDAAAFPAPGEFSSWAGVCPGSNISAGESPSARSPKRNRLVRKILTQAAQAAVRKKGGHLQAVFRRFVPKLGYEGATWAVVHRLACLVWKISQQRSPLYRTRLGN